MQLTELRPLRLLMIEDAEDDASLLALELKRSGYDLAYERVDSPEAMRAALQRQTWDVITSDHAMPRFSAPAALAVARELVPEVPFIIVSGEIDLNLAVTLLKEGAHDYIQKRELARVPPAIDREMREMEFRRQRRQAEEERRISEEKFFKAFHNSPDSINVTRLSDGKYLAVNAGFERMSGYTAAEALGQSPITLNIWADPADRVRLAAKLIEYGAFDNEEGLTRRRDGTLIPVLFSARLITINGEQCVIAFTRDLSLQKQAEESLRRHNRELQAINQITAAVTTQLDQASLLTTALHGVIDLTGLESGTIYLLDPVDQNLHLAATYNAAPTDGDGCRQVAQSGRPSFQRDPASADGLHEATFPLTIQNTVTGVMCLRAEHAVPVSADTLELVQNLCGAVALALENARLYEAIQRHADELEEHVAERTTQLSALNQELEAFSYSAAHDMRAPLRAIDGYSYILLNEHAAEQDAEGKELLVRIRANVERMQQMLDGLLTLSRITQTPLKREPVDLSAMAQAVAHELQQHAPQRLVAWRINPGLLAKGDRSLLHTVLENLLGNAWKYTAGCAEGQIELGQLSASTPPGETIYYVRDNGAGFDMNRAGQLFQVFRRLHASSEFPGTGVGLASVKRILRRHGGRIWAESMPGQGATFFFTLE